MRRAWSWRPLAMAGIVFALVGVAPQWVGSLLVAQDIEAIAELRGLELPQGYYDRVARDAKAFQLPNGLFRVNGQGLVEAVRPVSGTHRLLVLPALFSDSEEPHITREMIQASLFDGPAPYGTITEAYMEMSRGQLTLIGEVLPWVRTSRPMAAVVGTENGLGDDADLAPYFIEALELSDETIDFGLYDNDGPDNVPNSGDDDGFVDAMTFEFLEIGGSCGGPSIWPHRYGISASNGGESYTSTDARPGGGFVRVNAYIVQGATDCEGEEVQIANVISHEYGHVLGLPDFYHPTASGGAEGRRWVLGCWALMAAGSWGCGPVVEDRVPYGPSHMSVRNKNVLGWLDFTEVGLDPVSNQEYVLDPVQTSGDALRIHLDSEGREYLLVEYRAQVGFDSNIPADGVLVYHQDLEAATRPASGLPYFLALLEQDDNDGLIRNTFEGGNRGEAGDAWGVGGVADELSGVTSPSTRLNDGSVTPVVLHSIVVENGQARITLSTRLVVGHERIVQFFLEPNSAPLTELELSYVDSEGNRNGQLDVGDLRSWLREHGN
ncbi:MAG TPA: M6 family metalloprotease domain-containing protein [Gemmatimonadetes bacterium]|nr:M6 family metalloprotease domain-containing protein [Gemmatimonadota bacterium]